MKDTDTKKEAAELIEFLGNPKTNLDSKIYTSDKVRRIMYFTYNNRFVRGGNIYEMLWKNLEGGVWEITADLRINFNSI